MKRHHFIALAGLLLLLWWIGYVTLVNRATPSHAIPWSEAVSMPVPERIGDASITVESGHDPDVQVLQETVAQLSAAVTALRQQLQDLAAAPSQPHTPVDLLSTADENFPNKDLVEGAQRSALAFDDVGLAQEAQRYRQRMDRIADHFWSEPIDSEWSIPATDAIENALYRDAPAPTAMSTAECRATLCRVETHHEDPTARSGFEHRLIQQVGALLPRMTTEYIDHEDGSTSTILYLAREGFDFSEGEGQAH